MSSTRKSKPSCVRPGRGVDFRDKAAAFSAAGVPVKHDTRTLLRRGGQPLRNLCDVPLSGWCRFQGCWTLAQQGYVGNSQSAVGEFANCCDVSSSRELRTNPPVIDGVAKSWNAGGIATSPEGWCAGSCSLEGVSHLAPRPTTTVPVADLAGRPDLIERDFTADAPVPETGG